MGIRNLEVVVMVTDRASKDLDKVSDKVRKTGDAAKKASVDFTGFNRTLFATTAFVGTFFKAFQGMNRAFQEGADLDRISNQFDRLFGTGSTSSLTSMIRNFTDTYVDEMALMKEATSLRSLGIVKSLDEVVRMGAMAAVAAKRAGKTSEEGMKEYFAFLKDGEVSHLQNLNLITKTNTGLMAQNAILGKYGGVFNQIISVQAKKALGDRLLYQATKDLMKGQADLADTLGFVSGQWKFLRGETGRFLLTAMQPLIEKFGMLLNTMRLTIATFKEDKNLLFLAKSFITVTGSVLALAGALGTLRLASFALMSLGLGLPALVAIGVTLSSVFLGLTSKTQGVIDKFKLVGAFIKGVWQLVTSLDSETGIAKIDKDIAELLEKNGIFKFAKQVAKVGSVIKTVFTDIATIIKNTAKLIDDSFGGVFSKLIDLISKNEKPWENFWVGKTATPMQKFVRNFAVIGGTIGTIFSAMIGKILLGKAAGLLSKIPGLGFLGGTSGGRGPKGTSRDPMYVTLANGISGFFSGAFSKVISGAGSLLGTGPIASVLKLFTQTLGSTGFISALGEIPVLFGLLVESSGGVFAAFRMIAGAFTTVGAIVAVASAAIYGAIEGIILTAEDYGKFFKGIYDVTKAVGGFLIDWAVNSKIAKSIGEALNTTFLFIKEVVFGTLVDVLKAIANIFKTITGVLGITLGTAGESWSKWAKEFNPKVFTEEKTPFTGTTLGDTASVSSAGESGQKTNISVPQDATSEDSVDSVGQLLKTLSGEQRKQVQQAYEDAISSTSPGGAAMTAEEYANLQRLAKREEVGLLSQIAENTKKTSDSKVTGSRR